MKAEAPEQRIASPQAVLRGDLHVATLRAFIRSFSTVLIPLSVPTVSAYLLLGAVGRSLDPRHYAVLVPLLACVVVLSVPSAALQAPTAGRGATPDETAQGWLAGDRKSVALLVAGSLIILALTPALDGFLHLGVSSGPLLLPAYLLLSGLGGLAIGRIQRDGSARTVAALALVRPFGWVGGSVALVKAGLGTPGPLVAVAGTEALVLIVAASALVRRRPSAPPASDEGEAPAGPAPRDAPIALALFGTLWLAFHLDVLMARHYLRASEAARYAVGWTTARIFVLPLAALVWIALRAIAARDQGRNVPRWIRIGVAISLGGAAATTAAMLGVRGPMVALLFGHGAQPAASLVPKLEVTAGLLVVGALLVQFHVLVRSHAHLLVLAAAALQIVFKGIFYRTADEVALAAIGGAALCTALLYHAAMAISRWPTPLSALSPHEEFIPAAGPISNRSQVQLSVVLPCHNAGAQLEAFLISLQDHLRGQVPSELIVVSDGSTDDTVRIAGEFASDRVRVFHYPVRLGKGHALRVGLNQARGDYVAFIDSDGDIDPAAIVPFLSLMKLYEPDIVLGSKRHPLSRVEYPPMRRLLSWVYHLIGRFLFRINVRDTQTGLKMIRREVLAAVLPRMLEKRYAFDLELLVVARRQGFTRIFEAPVKIGYRFTSNVNPTAAFLILLDTAAIFYRRYVLNSYAPSAPSWIR